MDLELSTAISFPNLQGIRSKKARVEDDYFLLPNVCSIKPLKILELYSLIYIYIYIYSIREQLGFDQISLLK